MNVAEPHQGALGLAANPHRVEMAGRPEDFDWPELCPSCGEAARETIRIRKVFFRSGPYTDGYSYHVITAVDVPFCAACVELHRREEPGITPLRWFTSTLMSPLLFAMLFAAAAALFCLKEALADLSDRAGVAVMGGMAVFFVLIVVASWFASIASTKRLRVPAQTSVTLAFDFSDDLSKIFDGSRRLYAIRNEAFAKEFESLNGSRVWRPESPTARAALAKRKFVYYAVGAVAIAVTVLEWLR